MVFSKIKQRLSHSTSGEHVLDVDVIRGFNNVSLKSLFLPIFLLLLIIAFFLKEHAFSIQSYVNIQKDLFLSLNAKLSVFPSLQYNLTQLGDVLIFLPFFALLMVYAPKFWEALISSLIVSLIFSTLLKKIFAVPRPAAMFDQDSFVILGQTLTGSNSLPSGHSISTFTILTAVFFAFMPKKASFKITWALLIFLPAVLIVFTRVGVGAHYPFDVIIGSIFGYISAVLGILIYKKFNVFSWLTNRRYYPISLILFAIGVFALTKKIVATNLIIFYFSLIGLLLASFLITYIYVKKQN